MILWSGALRAASTFTELNTGWRENPAVANNCCEEFYNCNLEIILNFIYQQDDKINNLLLIGHNPLWSELCSYLSGSSCRLDTGECYLFEKEIMSWNQTAGAGTWLCHDRIRYDDKS